jgi:serine/threonine protein kinase
LSRGDEARSGTHAVQIDDYQVISHVGRGPRGDVWHARAANGREVALKVFHPHLSKVSNFVFRFEKETSALGALSHPNVARLVDRGRSRDNYFIATEWLGSTSLATQVVGTMPPSEAVAVCVAICEALDYTHRRGLPHRNLSFENVFVDSAKHVRLTDFGLARLGSSNFVEFAPDEARNDLHDLATLLYRLVTSRAPQQPLLVPSKIVPGIPKRLDEVIAQALSESRDRYSRASEMAVALRLVTSSNGAAARHEAAGLSFTIEGRYISVQIASDASAQSCEAGLQELAKHLAQPGPWRVAYDLGNLLQLENGVQAAILRLHLRHQKNLERVAFYSPRSLVRASALVVGSSVKRLPWKSFAGEALMRTWLWEGTG